MTKQELLKTHSGMIHSEKGRKSGDRCASCRKRCSGSDANWRRKIHLLSGTGTDDEGDLVISPLISLRRTVRRSLNQVGISAKIPQQLSDAGAVFQPCAMQRQDDIRSSM